MTLFGGKLPGTGDLTYGDQEKDANSLLMELDKGLRSPKPGEQCEAIVRFPRLFEKYPFPILINSAFLKLADLFRVGSNFLRQCILKVTQQSEKHLDKIPNVDEFLRRIYSVIHSNDPVARAITLRTLGHAARIISERKNVHHSIINGLDSHDAVEQDAAIFAASCFAAQSKSFASIIFTKLEERIQGLATPVHMKLKLIPIFQHMHHDSAIARKVIDLCMTTLLPHYPSRAFVQTTLHTLSLLADRSLCDVPKQIDLLLQYLETDCRKSVKIVSLQGLLLLAKRSPHMWSEHHIQALCRVGLSTPYLGLKTGLLQVLTALSGNVAVSKFSTHPDSEEMQFCTECCYESHLLVASYGAQLFTHMAIHQVKAHGVLTLSEVCSTVLDMLITLTAEPGKYADQARQICMTSVVQLCKACPSVTEHFIDALMSSIAGSQGLERLTLCHCLSALASYRDDLLPSLIPDLLTTLQAMIQEGIRHTDSDIVVALVTLLLQVSIEDGVNESVMAAIQRLLVSTNSWVAYKIARQATRYGHHALAGQIFRTLINQVSSEHYYFWLNALKECCLGESSLRSDISCTKVTEFVRQVSQAEIHYHNAVSALKAASTPSQPLDFQVSYFQHRADLLQIFIQIVQICCSFQTSPPPAIATSLTMTTGQEFHRCRHVIFQLKECQKRADGLAEAYGTLYKSSFDADVSSHNNLQMLQETCHLLSYVLDVVFSLSKREVATASREGLPTWKSSYTSLPLEYLKWGRVCEQVQDLVHQVIPTPCQATLTHFHIECIQKMAMLLCEAPLSLPRFFYQQLQTTDIKLALSPQPRSQNEPISVHYDTSLTLKTEGVIQHGQNRGKHRQVKLVKLSVISAQQSRGPTISEEKTLQENPTNEMTQVSEPLNDYFSSHFLLAFPVTGLHLVTLMTSVQDDCGATWNVGTPVTLMVKSYDEAVQRQQQQQYAAQRQQQRAALVATMAGNS